MYRALLALALLCLGALCAAAESGGPPTIFCAAIVSRAAGVPATPLGRLCVRGPQVRIQSSEAPSGFFLLDGRSAGGLFVLPAQRVFMDAGRATRLARLFAPVEPQAPCPGWQAVEVAAATDAAGEWRCDGPRATTAGHLRQYRVRAPGQPAEERWVDEHLGIAVRVTAADGTTLTLEQTEGVADAAFTVPEGFHRLEPGSLLKRLRHSDVWVEAPRG